MAFPALKNLQEVLCHAARQHQLLQRVPTLKCSCAKSLANRPGVSTGLLRAGLTPSRSDVWIFGFLIQGDLLLIFLLDVFFYKQQYS